MIALRGSLIVYIIYLIVSFPNTRKSLPPRDSGSLMALYFAPISRDCALICIGILWLVVGLSGGFQPLDPMLVSRILLAYGGRVRRWIAFNSQY